VTWLDKTSSYFRYREMGLPVLGVRDESLVSESAPILKAMLNAIGCSWDDSLLKNPDLPHPELFPHGTSVGETNPSRPIDAKSVGRWRDMLTREEEQIALEIAKSSGTVCDLFPPRVPL